MHLTPRHRRVARTIWECGGRLEEAARRERVRPSTLRRWLADPGFRALLAEDALEPLLQATSAVLRWAPAAVARLIRDLDSDSAAEARQAAREILRLALDAQRDLVAERTPRRRATAAAARGGGGPSPGRASTRADADSAAPPWPPAEDDLTRRVADLSDDQLLRIFAILNQAERPPEQGDPR